MVRSENHYRTAATVIVAVLLSLALTGTLTARDLKCTNFTSFKDVRRMNVIDDTVWMATSGGLLAVTDFSERGRGFVNQNGLGTNDITDIIADADGQKWVTGFGRLIRFDDTNPQQYLFFDSDDKLFELYRVADDGDQLWIGTKYGLVLFSKTIDNGQIQDSYQLFGDLNPSPIVYDIWLTGDSIWIATSSGLAVAERTNPALLKSPSSWTVYSLSNHPELLTDTVIRVAGYEDDIYVATSRRVFRIDSPDFSEVTSSSTKIYQLQVENDSLIAYYVDGSTSRIGVISGGTVVNLSTSGLPAAPQSGVGDGTVRWVGTVGRGVYANEPGTYTEYPYIGLPGNNISDITVNSQGGLSVGFDAYGAARLEDSTWIRYGFNGITTVLITDSSENTLMGTIGNGLWMWDGDTLKNYDETNSPMRGNIDFPPAGESFVINSGIVTDGRYLYTTCYRALNDYPLVIGDMEHLDDPLAWDSVGTVNGLTEIYVGIIDYFNGRLAVATEGNGVFVCDVGFDPLNHNITCQHLTRENSLLSSNAVRSVQFAPDGILWAGTNLGVSRYDPGIDYFRDVSLPAEMSSDITALEFDSRGNLWIGSRNGLGYRDATTGQIQVFNTLNSDIVSNEIKAVTYDAFTGDVYISTTSGYSYVPSDIGTPVYEVDDALAFPNPFVIRNSDDKLTFSFARDGSVAVYTVAGELIRELSVNTGWDGKNAEGRDVASGVYLYVITDNDGNSSAGKILLIRK